MIVGVTELDLAATPNGTARCLFRTLITLREPPAILGVLCGDWTPDGPGDRSGLLVLRLDGRASPEQARPGSYAAVGVLTRQVQGFRSEGRTDPVSLHCSISYDAEMSI
jgi:hypothetical protein